MRNNNDDKARELIATDFTKSYLAEASAGTGKTTLLVRRIINALIDGHAKPEEVVGITFTTKAADEMKAKLLKELFRRQLEAEGDDRERLNGIIASFGTATISTIHSFYLKLLAEFPVESGIDLDVGVLEEGEETDAVWHGFITEGLKDFRRLDELDYVLEYMNIGVKYFKDLCYTIMDYPELKLSGLPPAMDLGGLCRTAIKTFDDFVTWIPSSIAKCNDPDNDRYCIEIGRIRDTWASLKNAGEEEQLSYLTSIKGVHAPEKEELDNWDKVKNPESGKPKNAGKIESENANDLIAGIKKLIADYLFGLGCDILDEFINRYFKEYQEKNSKLTFQGSILKARNLLKDSEEVREHFRKKYKLICVDEFQDTDPLQAEVIAMLSSVQTPENNDWRKTKIAPGKIFIVGDPKQSIYRFRRADISIYEEFKKLFKEDELLDLCRNFRSYECITETANRYFKPLMIKDEALSAPEYKEIDPNRGKGGEVILLNMDLVKKNEPEENYAYSKPSNGLKADFIREREPKVFAGWLNKLIKSGKCKVTDTINRDSVRAITPGDILILFKNKKNMQAWANALEAYRLPVENISGMGFYGRQEIKDAIALLTAAAYPDDAPAVYAALKSPVIGLGDSEIYKLSRAGHGLRYKSNDIPDEPGKAGKAIGLLTALNREESVIDSTQAARHIIERSGMLHYYAEIIKDRAAVNALIKLADTAEEVAGSEGLDLKETVERLIELQENEEKDLFLAQDRPSAIRMMTIHQAKGLDSPMVVLADMTAQRESKGKISKFIDREKEELFLTCVFNRQESYEESKDFEFIPDAWEEYKESEAMQLRAELLRLEYVACTRARDYMVVTAADIVRSGWMYNNLCQFLKSGGAKIENIGISGINEPKKAEIANPGAETIGLEEYRKGIEKTVSEFHKPAYRKVLPSQLAAGREDKREDGYGAEFGTALHGLMAEQSEMLSLKPDLSGYEYSEALARHIDNIIQSKVWIDACEAKEKHSEFSLGYYSEGSGELVAGSIDLAYKTGAGWTLADYKTHKITKDKDIDKFTEEYRLQIMMYKDAFEKITGEKVDRTVLLFSDTGKEIIL